MIRTVNFIFAFTFFSFSLLAKPIDITLDEKQAFPVEMSDIHHNRVSIVDGNIEKIIGNPNYFDIEINDKLGHAFITLKKPLEKPQALSIVTPSGRVQDLLVSSKEIEPTTIFIEEPVEPQAGIEVRKTLASVSTLCEIFDGKQPEGFHKRDLYENETVSVGEELLYHIQKVDVLEGALENLYLIRLKNFQRKPIKIHSKALQGEKVSWVFAPKSELLRNEETTLVVSREKD